MLNLTEYEGGGQDLETSQAQRPVNEAGDVLVVRRNGVSLALTLPYDGSQWIKQGPLNLLSRLSRHA